MATATRPTSLPSLRWLGATPAMRCHASHPRPRGHKRSGSNAGAAARPILSACGGCICYADSEILIDSRTNEEKRGEKNRA
jgi:hypothetical protein